MKQKFKTAKELIKKAENILIATHESPDEDALGSMLGLKIALENMDKNVCLYCTPCVPSCMCYLPQANHVKNHFNLAEIDLIIGVDYAHYDRLGFGNFIGNLSAIDFLTFDHHLIGNHLGLPIINTGASSTCEIIFDFLEASELPITPEIATCLLAGIYSDTGGFRHPNTNAKTFQVAARLLAYGASFNKIVSTSSGKNNLKTLNKIMENLAADKEIGIVYSVIEYEYFEDLDEEPQLSDLTNLLCSVNEANLAVLLKEKKPGQIECSLRSKKGSQINVAKIAQHFGGGGHQLAAGFQIKGQPKEILGKIKNIMAEIIVENNQI